jgi:hypothetical protein
MIFARRCVTGSQCWEIDPNIVSSRIGALVDEKGVGERIVVIPDELSNPLLL